MIFDDVLNAVIDMAEVTQPYANIIIGSLPPDNGICITGSSSPDETYLCKDMLMSMDVVLNGKHTNQQTLSNALGAIHVALTKTMEYPQTSEYQITNISTVAAPRLLDREQNSQWLYGSSLRVDFYWR